MAKSEHLHLGYCEDPDAVFETNKELREAQENYLRLCKDMVPDNVSTVLDIGADERE